MAERDRFELDLTAALRAYLEEAPTEVRPTELARQFATAYPHRRDVLGRWGFRLTPALAWALLLVGLLVGLLVSSLMVGARRPDRAVVIAPSPMPWPTVIAIEGDVLATTKAKPLPSQATCPPGSTPDTPGPPDQERPSSGAGSMVFDRHAGRIILYASMTWTFDPCNNRWQRMQPAEQPPVSTELAPTQLVYDADSDRTLAFTDSGQVWTYDLAADRWTQEAWFQEPRGIARTSGGFEWNGGVAAVYHDRSGLVILYNGESMWAYDVDTNTLAKVRQRPDPSHPAGAGYPQVKEFGKLSLGYDPLNDLLVAHVVPEEHGQAVTWTFNPATGTWHLEAAVGTPDVSLVSGYIWPEVGARAAFDGAAGLTVFVSRGLNGPVEAYDAAQRSWRTLFQQGSNAGDRVWCDTVPPVSDPLNKRIVCRAGANGSGVSAFTSTGAWRWLLVPSGDSLPSH